MDDRIEDLDFENISYGLTDEDLDDVIEDVKGQSYDYSGKKCRIFKRDTEVTMSRQSDWFAAVAVDWTEREAGRNIQHFQSEIWDTEKEDSVWLISRVGNESQVSREDAEEEAEWLAEQLIMIENDPTQR